MRITVPHGDWIDYDPATVCQVPNCEELSMHPHHIVRRSATGGPKRWVAIDGLVLPNVMGICGRHHQEVTGQWGGHWAKVVFPLPEEIQAGLYRAWWLWYARLPGGSRRSFDWELMGPIDPPVYI